jgi:hypothetical protein
MLSSNMALKMKASDIICSSQPTNGTFALTCLDGQMLSRNIAMEKKASDIALHQPADERRICIDMP